MADTDIDEDELDDKPKEKEPLNIGAMLIPAILSFLGFVAVYLLVANLSFFNIIPFGISSKLPLIAKPVRNLKKKAALIAIEQQRLADLKKIIKIGELEINLKEEDLGAEGPVVPFLFKLRVTRKEIGSKQFAEVWIDQTLVMRFFSGLGKYSPYVRAKYVVKKINMLLNETASFDDLLPVIEGDRYIAQLGEEIVFEVKQEDAIFNNSEREDLLISWINNIRVPLGFAILKKPKILKKPPPPPPGPTEKELAEKAQKKKDDVAKKKKTKEQMASDRIEKLKKVSKVYEKMELGKVAEVLKRMSNRDAEDILRFIDTRKITKLYAILPPAKSAVYYRDIMKTDEDQKQFGRFLKMWEKLPAEDTITLLKKLTMKEKERILKRVTDRRKAKLFSAMPANEAKQYLKLLAK
jgi:flagellar motility protein MotE (MotC chaperone)